MDFIDSYCNDDHIRKLFCLTCLRFDLSIRRDAPSVWIILAHLTWLEQIASSHNETVWAALHNQDVVRPSRPARELLMSHCQPVPV